MPNTTSTPLPESANGSRRPRLPRRPRPQSDPTTPAPAAAAPAGPPLKMRRRPALWALGVAITALGALAAAWVATTVGHTHPVLAVRSQVLRGEVLQAGDVTVARINADPALHTVPAAGRDSIIGKRAAVDLTAGALLTPQSVTAVTVPATGQSLVGVTLTPAQLPAQPLRPNDHVRIVDTPRPQDEPPTGEPGAVPAVVVATRRLPDTGQIVVDVTVPTEAAAAVAAHAATARVALVLDSH